MPHYIVTSSGPLSIKEVNRPDFDFGTPSLPWIPGEEIPGTGGPPVRPGHPIWPSLPPREEWPPLPPGLEGGLPIPPDWGIPTVPLPPEVDPPGIWPPVKPEFPDLSGKSLALALIYVSRHVRVLRWIVVDHEEAQEAAKKAFEAFKSKLPPAAPGQGPVRPPR